MRFVSHLRRYSSVNQDIQTASIRASLGLSMRLPSESLCCIAGIVFRVIPEEDKFDIFIQTEILQEFTDCGDNNKGNGDAGYHLQCEDC